MAAAGTDYSPVCCATNGCRDSCVGAAADSELTVIVGSPRPERVVLPHSQREAQSLTRNKIVSNQVRYSLADRTIEAELLPWCQKNDITVIAFSPLARSIEKIRGSLDPNVLEHVAREEGRTAAQVALNWCTARDGVVAIPRASTVEHVGDVCAASGWRLSPARMALLDGA
jgi:diketogulonate reductase-like aldo/keto reductase